MKTAEEIVAKLRADIEENLRVIYTPHSNTDLLLIQIAAWRQTLAFAGEATTWVDRALDVRWDQRDGYRGSKRH